MTWAALDRLFTGLTGTSFVVTYWDGRESRYGDGPPRFAVRLHDHAACVRMLLDPGSAFGEAYAAGHVEVEGDLDEFFRIVFTHDVHRARGGRFRAAATGVLTAIVRNTAPRASKNVRFHYDLGNEFYASWLGQDLVYSCAYFRSVGDDIDTAQFQKLDHICHKLQLYPGESFLDVGCGWGALVIHAAREFGVNAVGITLSVEQKAEADLRVAAAGLSDRVSIELRDYRSLAADHRFDKVASVGMLEHVGKAYLPAFMQSMASALRPGGLALVQTIGSALGSAPHPWIARNIFPGIYLPALGEVTAAAACHGLLVTDIESLRLHYALTMTSWAEAFEANAGRAPAGYGPSFVRKWRLYLRGCAAAFRHGKLDLWQVCLTSGVRNDLPLTRSHLYASGPGQGVAAGSLDGRPPAL